MPSTSDANIVTKGNQGKFITLADGTTFQIAEFNGKSNATDVTKLKDM